jgi:hypothetical protein
MQHAVTRSQNFTFGLGEILQNPPPLEATLVVNPEPHTGACPSARLRVGLATFQSQDFRVSFG